MWPFEHAWMSLINGGRSNVNLCNQIAVSVVSPFPNPRLVNKRMAVLINWSMPLSIGRPDLPACISPTTTQQWHH